MNQVDSEERLINNIKDNKPFHAYIFEGNKNEYRKSFAQNFAQSITPYKEDITVIAADDKSVKDEAILYLQRRLSVKPYIGNWNVAIIEDADTMTVRAQNRLLKTLEEPIGNTVIILLTENVENLLPTILSRCVIYRINQDEHRDKESDKESQKQAEMVGTILIERQSFYSLLPILKEVTESRTSAYVFLDALEIWYRDLILYTIGITEQDASFKFNILNNSVEIDQLYQAIRLIEQARRDLNKNINVGYTIKYMLLEMM